MKVFFDKNDLQKLENTCVTIGTFDGLHVGHQNILNVLINIAKEKKLQSTVVSFDPHPRRVVKDSYDIKILTTIDEKIEILEALGIDNFYLINFTTEFSQQSSDEFVKNYITGRFDAKHVVVGHDHKFGKNRGGDAQALNKLGSQYGFGVTSVDAVKLDDEIISSSNIRKALINGNIEKANAFLGRSYSMKGEVVTGAKRGRILGFPTANLSVGSTNKLIPQNGVYAVGCELNGEKLNGVMNIGYRPTFDDTTGLVPEVHLFNFNRLIYGETLKINFIQRIRAEKKFASKEDLINQIELDKKEAAKVLAVELTN
jgi:riboflavin kinase/FMN adenylyltransferase